jgi:hypothetical protein
MYDGSDLGMSTDEIDNALASFAPNFNHTQHQYPMLDPVSQVSSLYSPTTGANTYQTMLR